jgi:hypothetical protein
LNWRERPIGIARVEFRYGHRYVMIFCINSESLEHVEVYGDIGVFVLGGALLTFRMPLDLQNARRGVLWKTQVELPLRGK